MMPAPAERRRLHTAWTRSLRFRLTAWYTGALAVVLLPAAILLYFGAQHALLTETDAFLSLEARRLAKSAAGTAGDQPDTADLNAAINEHALAGGQDVLRQGPYPAFRLLLFDVVYLRLIDRTGNRVIAASPDLARQPALLASLDPLLARATDQVPGQFAFAGPDEEQTMRVLTMPLRIRSGAGYVQAAVPWDHNADVLERLGLLLLIGLSTMLLTAAGGGWLLVGRTLQPIGRIVAEAERLDANALPEALLPDAIETDGEIGQLVATLNGMITRLQRAFEVQRQYLEAQQRFASDASHELRTPLTILRGEMELALSRPRVLEVYRATLTSAVEEIDQMTRIVEGLSLLARQDASLLGAKPSHHPVDLTYLTGLVVTDFAPQAAGKQIDLQYEMGKNASTLPVWVRGNADLLQRLLRNLLDNALKYTSPHGKVTVILEVVSSETTRTREVTLTVHDTGIGIAARDLPHVFDRFWRAAEARSAEGSGLGLAICAQIANAHGGRMTAESQLGQGSTFRCFLPVSENQG